MWFVVRCRSGCEEEILRSCRTRLSPGALDEAFRFRCERFWRSDGAWRRVERDMFPGYVFLQSARPELLSEEIKKYRAILPVLGEPGYLIPVYQEEENYLRQLCGEQHVLRLSYGYRDRKHGCDCITKGPLKEAGSRILAIDWHRRFARVEVPLARRTAVMWAGVAFDGCKEAGGAENRSGSLCACSVAQAGRYPFG